MYTIPTLSSLLCQAMGLDASIGLDVPLESEGLDSLGAMDVRNALQARHSYTA